MLNIFKKKNKKDDTDDNIVILKKTEPGTCGGTDATLDRSAPKEIDSDELCYFDVTSALGREILLPDNENAMRRLEYVSAFAVPAGGGSFLYLETGESFRWREDNVSSFAFVKENVFPALAALVRDCALAKSNGYHSVTHGLPENFGGSVEIRYATGERISFSDNQAPIITPESGKKIAEFFRKALNGEKEEAPDLSQLCAIRFSEERANGGFTKAELSFLEDGAGVNKKSSRYDAPKIYESEKPVDEGTIRRIKETIAACGLLLWRDLPERSCSFGNKKTMTFVFTDGREITVRDDRALPSKLSRGFFDIELEMTTKH